MFLLSRSNNKQIEYWNGVQFLSAQYQDGLAKAKRFASQKAGLQEASDAKACWFDHEAGRWQGLPVNCNPE